VLDFTKENKGRFYLNDTERELEPIVIGLPKLPFKIVEKEGGKKFFQSSVNPLEHRDKN